MKPKILIIEDNEQNLYLITFIMEKNNFEVIQARDGLSGVELAAKHRPDLILLDIQLPVRDGYSIARDLRGNVELNTVPIIAVTSFAMVGDREKAIASGFTDYIEKPINPETIVKEIIKHLPPGDPELT